MEIKKGIFHACKVTANDLWSWKGMEKVLENFNGKSVGRNCVA